MKQFPQIAWYWRPSLTKWPVSFIELVLGQGCFSESLRNYLSVRGLGQTLPMEVFVEGTLEWEVLDYSTKEIEPLLRYD